jgi:2-polyprenyl-3-methyl-5-hydroxy-6-metoxy-1,4-benzoquinol methylase
MPLTSDVPPNVGRSSDYDAFSAEYSAFVSNREANGVEDEPFGILPRLLELLGPVQGARVLDAGCGLGYLARVLDSRGAVVTGIDLSPRLVELAVERENERPEGTATIDYRVADLSAGLPEGMGPFDAIASYLVLNDVDDYRGFASTLAGALVSGGRLVLALNNPYGAVLRGHVTDYFASGTVSPYRGLWAAGIRVYHRHRTLAEYLDAFLGTGLRLVKLADLDAVSDAKGPASPLPDGHRFPRFMLLAFEKP